MNDPTPLPSEYRTLIGLLRCAVHRKPPEGDLLPAADWPATLRLARQHGVDTYLYPWLAEHAPALFSPHADAPPDSAPAAWRALFLEAVPRTLLRQRQLAELLAAFARAGIDVIPLKGAWLSETLYDDPVRRTMSDLDVLVRECDLDSCHAALSRLGYRAVRDVRHNAFFKDQTYFHDSRPFPVEAHWDLSAAQGSPAPHADVAALWRRTAAAALLSEPVRRLSPEDQLLHLAQHIVLHNFAMPLRGYLDVALLLGGGLRPEGGALDAATGAQLKRCAGFVLAVVSQLFALSLPDDLARLAQPADPVRLAEALESLTRLPAADKHRGELMLARLGQTSLTGRIRFLLGRLFLPRSLLALTYPCARRPCGVPLAWLCRLRDLARRYRGRVGLRLRPSAQALPGLAQARKRQALLDWLMENKKPG
jgi:hypothetical protein